MSTEPVVPRHSLTAPVPGWASPLVWLAIAFVVLYLPTYFDLATEVWTDDEEAHGPIVVAVAAWALWQVRDRLTGAPVALPSLGPWVLMITGLLAFAIGRLLDIAVLEVGSQIPVLAAGLWLVGGRAALGAAAFPLLYLLFVIPLPGTMVDSLTGGLKQWVSVIATEVLIMLDYPVARSGVLITVGQYQLLVADACSGLKSIFSLSAIGILYIYLMRHGSVARNAVLASALVPIAFVANVLRVLILILVTYHFGDAAGQGFVHGFAGMVLFILSIGLLWVLDTVLGFFFPAPARRGER